MSRGRHAPGDGPLGPSLGAASGRGLALLGVAVVVAVVLLHTEHPVSPGAGPTTTTSTTAAPGPIGPVTPASAPTTTIPRAQVNVLVANGTKVPLGASHLATALASLGYHLATPSDTTQAVTASSVYFAAGYEQPASAIAGLLGLDPSTVLPLPAALPVTTTTGINVVVVEGTTLAQRFASSSSLSG